MLIKAATLDNEHDEPIATKSESVLNGTIGTKSVAVTLKEWPSNQLSNELINKHWREFGPTYIFQCVAADVLMIRPILMESV